MRRVAALALLSIALAGPRCTQAGVLFPRTDDGIEVLGEIYIHDQPTGLFVSEGTCVLFPVDALPGLKWCEAEGERRCSDPIDLFKRSSSELCERLRFVKRAEDGTWSMTAMELPERGTGGLDS